MWKDGGATTQGTGIRPIEGALQPLGTLAYRCALGTTRDGEMVDPHGAEPSSGDWYLRAQCP